MEILGEGVAKFRLIHPECVRFVSSDQMFRREQWNKESTQLSPVALKIQKVSCWTPRVVATPILVCDLTELKTCLASYHNGFFASFQHRSFYLALHQN